MTELIVVGFKKDMYRASEALDMLHDMNTTWMVDLSDAVALYRDYTGTLRVDHSYQKTTGEGAGWGGLFGGLVGALDAQDWKETFGISEDFVQRVGTMVQTGDSAVFVLARTINPDLVAGAFKGYGGTVLRTSFDRTQEEAIRAALAGKPAQAPSQSPSDPGAPPTATAPVTA